MTNIGELFVRLSADPSGVRKGVQQANTSLTSLSGAAKALGGVLAGVFAAQKIQDFARASVAEFSEAEAVWSRLAATVDATGTSFDSVQGKINAAAAAMERATTVSDEDYATALQRLTLQTGDVSRAMAHMDLVADLSAAKQIDTASAADLLGKALAGNTTQLIRQFPALKKSTDLFGDLRKMIGDAAEKEVTTMKGATEQLTNAWGNFKEAVGRGLAGGNSSVDTINNLTNAIRGLTDWIDSHQNTFATARQNLADFGAATAREAATIKNAWQGVVDVWANAKAKWTALTAGDAAKASGFVGTGAGGTWGAPVVQSGSAGGSAAPNAMASVVSAFKGETEVAKRLRETIEQRIENLTALQAVAAISTPVVLPSAGNMTALGGVAVGNTPSAAGPGMFAQLASAMSPATILFQILAPTLQSLHEPIRLIGELLAKTLAPAISFVTQGIGWFVRSIGKAINFLLPGSPGNPLVKFGQEMIDAAQAVRKHGDAAKSASDSISNMPAIFDLALRRRQAGAGAIPGSTSGGGGGERVAQPRGGTTVIINNPPVGMDVDTVVRQVTRGIVEAKRRGGTSELSLALAS